MSLGFDLSVNNYSIEDLLSILDLGTNPSIPEVNNKINMFINMFKKSDNKNSNLAIQFFQDISERFNNDFFNEIEIESDNYLDYTQPFQTNLSRPFPTITTNNNLQTEELLYCDNNNNTIEPISDDDDITISNNTKFIDINKVIEYSVGFMEETNSEYERTVFKYKSTSVMNNTKSIHLSSISIPLPYTISEYKNNNRFIIIDNSSGQEYPIDISDCYFHHYTDVDNLIADLNEKYFQNSDLSGTILYDISLIKFPATPIRSQRPKLRFILDPSSSYTSFILSFDVSRNICINSYDLNRILGFDNILYNSSDPSNNGTISGNYIFFEQPRLYVSVDDNQVQYYQNLELIGSSILTNYILGSIYLNISDLVANNYILVNVMFTTEVNQFSRIYYGPVNLDTLTIKFYDVNGLLQQIPKEGFTQNTFYINIKYVCQIPDNSTLIDNSN